MSLSPEERDKRLHNLDETIGQNLDQQIKEHKASAKVALALHFNRELVAAEECAKEKGFARSFCPSHLGGNAKYNVKSAGEVKDYFLFREPIQ
ncbi:MAG: hypothetical protein ACRD47_05480 [Nitrososphaeraceae archaeon]